MRIFPFVFKQYRAKHIEFFPLSSFFNFSAQPQLLFHTDHGGLCVNISQLQVEDNEEKDKGLQLKILKDGFSDETQR